MNLIQLVRCYVLLKMFASKSHTKTYFETPFLIIFKYYAWASYGVTKKCKQIFRSLLAASQSRAVVASLDL